MRKLVHTGTSPVGARSARTHRWSSGARARQRRALCAAALAILLAAVASAPAMAALSHQFSFRFDGTGTPDGSLSNPNGAAVDQASGDVFVADVGHNVIDRFDASGRYLSQITGRGTPAGSFALSNPAALAVDNSGNALDTSAGDLYVVDSGNNVVDKFDRTGAYVGQLTTTPAGPLSSILGVSVDGAGGVWVYAFPGSSPEVDAFDFTGAFVTQEFTGFFSGKPGFAVDSGQRSYAVRGSGATEKFDAPAAAFGDLGSVDPGPSSAVAVNLATDAVYVDDGSHVAEYDSSMAATDDFGSAQLSDAGQSGLAVNSSTDRIYAANPNDGSVYAFDLALVPDVTTGAASDATGTSVTVAGTVNPLGVAARYQFEYGTDTSYGSVAPATPGDAGAGSSPLAVRAALAGLAPGTTYHYRLIATNANGTADGADATFTTPNVPSVGSVTSTGDVTQTAATVQGTIDPNLAETTYYVEYGTSTGYGARAPPAGGDIGAGANDVAIAQALAGLQPDTTYHYRVIASNLVGTTTGVDHAFTTASPSPGARSAPTLPGRGQLPDDRGWELVSPPGKNGGDVMGDSARTRAAADGSAATFASLQGFGDVRGTGVATEYMSQRSNSPDPGDNGWTTHAITPQQDPMTYRGTLQALEPMWEGELSADLTHGVFRAWSPVTDAPDVARVQNLYVRNDLRTPGAGAYALATECTACGGTPLPSLQTTLARPWLAGASSDFSHVVFESDLPLVPGATGDSSSVFNVYEWDNGVLRLASLVPPPGDSSCGDGGPACVPAVSALAGKGASQNLYTPHVVSDDGSHVFFIDNSTSGSARSGVLYERLGGDRTVQLNASEKSSPEAVQPATFETATPDGKRVFFTTAEGLVNGDDDGQPDLYMYDEDAPAGSRMTRLSVNPGSSTSVGSDGVLGTSDDGHWVYFLDGGFTILSWHDGSLSRVGPVSAVLDQVIDTPDNWNLNVLQARVTPDGHRLLFASHSGTGLTGHDHGSSCGIDLSSGGNPCQELYVYSADTGSTVCVSCNPNGGPSTDNASVSVRALQGGALTTWHLPHAFSNDGRKVFFSTRSALVPGDANRKVDAYEWEAHDTGGCQRELGCVELLSSGTDSADSYFMDASANGDDVFILTRQQLVGWDRDQNYDLYDARVNGGFPQPVPATPACSADTCQGPPASAPGSADPGTTTFSGPGNVKGTTPKAKKAKPVKCKRGFVRKKVKRKVRCVKRPKPHRRKKSARHGKKGGAK